MTTAQISDPESLRKENAELRCEVIYLKEQLAWFKRQIFGKKSERIVSDLNDKQLYLEGLEPLKAQEKEDLKKKKENLKRQGGKYLKKRKD